MDENKPVRNDDTCWVGSSLQMFTSGAEEVTGEAQQRPRHGRPIRLASGGPADPNGKFPSVLCWDDQVSAAVARAIDTAVQGPAGEAVKRAVAAAIQEALARQRSGER